MSEELRRCPHCGSAAEYVSEHAKGKRWAVACMMTRKVAADEEKPMCRCRTPFVRDKGQARDIWNRRAAIEYDGFFYLPKPNESLVEGTETVHVWDGTKVKTDVFYQLKEQAVINWARELDERIMERIAEVFSKVGSEVGSDVCVGKLTAEKVRKAVNGHGNIMDNRLYEDWQAVADELNTALGGWECELHDAMKWAEEVDDD